MEAGGSAEGRGVDRAGWRRTGCTSRCLISFHVESRFALYVFIRKLDGEGREEVVG